MKKIILISNIILEKYTAQTTSTLTFEFKIFETIAKEQNNKIHVSFEEPHPQ